MTDFPPLPVLGELTDGERALADAARHGRPVHGGGAIRAEVLRELLLGLRGPLDPRGVRLRGARVAGSLDLDHVEAVAGLALTGCAIDGPISARHAVLPWLDLSGSTLTSDDGPALHLDGLVVDGTLCLADAVVTGRVSLLGARLGEADLTGATLRGAESALDADGLRAGGLRLGGVTATASGDAAVSLTDARIEDQFTLAGAVLANDRGRGLTADRIRVGTLLDAEGVRATASGEYGAICLMGAHVGGNLDLEGAELANDSGAALSADRLRVDGVLTLDGAVATGSGDVGTLRLLSARIGGQVSIEDARITSDAGPALYADGLRVEGNLYLAGTHATGDGDRGTLRLHAAVVEGQLLAGGAELANGSGPGLSADDVRVGTYLDLSDVTARCASEEGAVSLTGAVIEGKATFDGAELANDAGPALRAHRCRIRESLALTGLRATGGGDAATVELLGTRVGGQLSFSGTEIRHRDDDGTLVSLEDVVVDGPAYFPVEALGERGLVFLDGFRYAALEEVAWRDWLDLVRSRTAGYRPGPYQRLAAVERAAGHDGNVRQILIAQQRDLRRRAPEAVGGRLARWFHGLWGALAGYGYRARRTAAALLLAVVAAGGLGLWAGHVGDGAHRAAERTADLTAATGTPCTTVELIGVGLDRGLPLSPGVRGRCDLNTGIGAGQVFTVAIWLVQAAVWALATLALVGYTGLVRKTG